jgi:hypothetical protein
VNPFDKVAMKLRGKLLSRKRPGSLTVTLVTCGEPDKAGARKFVSEGVVVPPLRRLNPEEELTGYVHDFNHTGNCKIKANGARSRLDAEFSSDDVVSMQLRLVSDGPEITVVYRQYEDINGADKLIRILRLSELSEQWEGPAGALDNLERAVDSLK